jgi:hypothetical protein
MADSNYVSGLMQRAEQGDGAAACELSVGQFLRLLLLDAGGLIGRT